MSRRALRNAKAVGVYIRGGQGRKRKDVARLVKKVFLHRGSPDTMSAMVRPDLPEEYLQEEESGEHSLRPEVPDALVLVLRNLRVFGHMENALQLELVRFIEYVSLRPGEQLFRVGEADTAMFVVESGAVKVHCSDRKQGLNAESHEGRNNHHHHSQQRLELKTVICHCILILFKAILIVFDVQVRAGEAIVSLLSFLEHLGGMEKNYKTVSAQAVTDTKLIKIPFTAFRDAFEKYPDSMARVVQVIILINDAFLWELLMFCIAGCYGQAAEGDFPGAPSVFGAGS